MRKRTVAIGFAIAIGGMLPGNGSAQAASPETRIAAPGATDFSAQTRRPRPPTRLRVYPRYNPDDVYPRYNPGPNAVRDCTATYVQEFRPSGAVIVPRMNCFWRRG